MPKMKSKSGAAKRFKVRASGGIKRSQAFKRQLRGMTGVHESDKAQVRAMLPYA